MMTRRIRKIKVHDKSRGSKMSRYQLINWAYKVSKQLNKMKETERHQALNQHFKYLLDNYKPQVVISIARIWCLLKKIEFSAMKVPEFERFHSTCGRFIVDEDNRDFALKAKSKMELLVRGHIKLYTLDQLVYELLKAETRYCPLTEVDFAELKRYVREVARERQFDLEDIDRAYTIHAWRVKNTCKRLYGIDILEEPED